MWSISVEDQLYAGMAIVCLVSLLLKRLTRIPAHWLVTLVLAASLIAFLWMRVRYFRRAVPTRVWPVLMGNLFHWRFEFLALGMPLAVFDRT